MASDSGSRSARALANEPPLLLGDEPTGSLDSKAEAQILDLLRELLVARGLSLLVVTHDLGIAGRVDRIVRMLDGRNAGERIAVGSFPRDGSVESPMTRARPEETIQATN